MRTALTVFGVLAAVGALVCAIDAVASPHRRPENVVGAVVLTGLALSWVKVALSDRGKEDDLARLHRDLKDTDRPGV